MAGYEQIRVADELSECVQRAARIAPGRHEVLGELGYGHRGARETIRPEDLISQEPTRYHVRVKSEGRSHHDE
jgi:hypothetical protein